ncbi:response regulator [Methylomicrobium sp. RS1]|jgi:two-component system phosphate regulon response regulator OmpR|uniref:response regulator n=1 Tax=Candidatus Methylomicrobium oryzae TaxID=2802053 RepID=UPI001924BAB5|nr:response regulator [Methylomicrobium sp. RS1]MBL1266099.1 response regulator [Methylomicrobium sp. RS1]
MKNAKILIVDDDRRLSLLLERYLREQGFIVQAVADGEQMNKWLARRPFDLIVLDWKLSGEDGLSICRRLSADPQSPQVIMLTANADEMSRIAGLEAGADDYLGKPFNPRELSARIHAVLRRRSRPIAAAPDSICKTLHFGPYALDCAERRLYREYTPIDLTCGEFALLKVLAEHAGKPLSRERLAHLIDGRDHMPNNRAIDIQISRLRRLLEDDPAHPRYLQTVWGLGYVLVQDQGVLA